ncbi:Flp pilus assembly protein CpaB [Thioclava sp. SK-1]|uniref:Flp pilus assembly protein CpaB n=1 Tax=Thioclava sp. SK-1 TaxID=1889770 RepID=UPI00082622DB|nr:Flp pilus assembly protein CpaB [Thioclava sp. SK-1]OCX65906.1 Flp pilus assembly protein CpaB [Thioclava sp. SK-1]
MRAIFALVLVLGVALAGAAVYLAQGEISNIQAQRDALAQMKDSAPKLVDVVVSKTTMKYGQRFTQNDLEVIKVQADKVPEHVFHLISAPMGSPQAPYAVFLDGETRPRAALRSMEVYEPLLSSKITEPGVDAGISASLGAGMRAFTIQVNAISSVSGFLRPGHHVDVYWSGTIDGRSVTRLIQPSLKLIAIDQNSDADRSAETQLARTVTAEVTPQQVAALTLAQSTGQLTLALVGDEIEGDMPQIEIDRNALLGIEVAEQVKVEAPRVCTIRTRKGGDVIETPIPCTN